jgi:hypothetical protein
MKRSILAVAALALALCPAAHAGQNPLRGAGATPCAVYTASLNNPAPSPLAVSRHLQFVQWVLGFVSAYDHFQRGALRVRSLNDDDGFSDLEDLSAWLESTCINHPKRDLFAASASFVTEQERRRK